MLSTCVDREGIYSAVPMVFLAHKRYRKESFQLT